MFVIGQKVVCVDAEGVPTLQLGSIYTISQILPPKICRWRGRWRDEIGLWFAELPVLSAYEAFGYAPDRFRPITDISIFTKMLEPENVQ